jgi:hypothetical protein
VTASVVDPLSGDPVPPANLPKFVVPNLDADTFDASALANSRAGKSQPSSQSKPTTQIKPDLQ